jgi:hypothetical protein
MKPHRTLSILALSLALPMLLACGSRPPSDPLQAQAWKYGIEILGVQITAGGEFARLNYRVIDYQKAKRSLSGEFHLLPENGERALTVASVGRLGPLRQRPSATGRPQFMLFTNHGPVLRKGDTAVLLIGKQSRIAGIPVS